MPSRRIPCSDCATETEELKELGKTVLSCEPVVGKPGWCEITWTDRSRRTTRAVSPKKKASVPKKSVKRKTPKMAVAKRVTKPKARRKIR
jgi:hypothetical protein